MKPWYEAKTGNHQGLVIEEETGRNVAVVYDKADARLIAAAPALYAALDSLVSAVSLPCTNLERDALKVAHAALAAADKGAP